MPDLQGYGWMLLRGLELTLLVGLAALFLAIVLGLVGAWGKLSSSRVARAVAGTYTTVVRGVPELLLILLVYYGTPTLIQNLSLSWGYPVYIDLDPFWAGTLTLGFIYGAFATEVFRGAFQSIPSGQIEAAVQALMAPKPLRRTSRPWPIRPPQRPLMRPSPAISNSRLPTPGPAARPRRRKRPWPTWRRWSSAFPA